MHIIQLLVSYTADCPLMGSLITRPNKWEKTRRESVAVYWEVAYVSVFVLSRRKLQIFKQHGRSPCWHFISKPLALKDGAALTLGRSYRPCCCRWQHCTRNCRHVGRIAGVILATCIVFCLSGSSPVFCGHATFPSHY